MFRNVLVLSTLLTTNLGQPQDDFRALGAFNRGTNIAVRLQTVQNHGPSKRDVHSAQVQLQSDAGDEHRHVWEFVLVQFGRNVMRHMKLNPRTGTPHHPLGQERKELQT